MTTANQQNTVIFAQQNQNLDRVLNPETHLINLLNDYTQSNETDDLKTNRFFDYADICFVNQSNPEKIAIDFLQLFLHSEMVKSILKSVFRVENNQYQLTCAIVLREDNHENRKIIFQFSNFYDELIIARPFPIYFRFIPLSVEQKFIATEPVIAII